MWKFWGCLSQVAQKIIDFTTELQRCESWENVPLEFRRLSVDSIIISVASSGLDPCNSVFPSFVGIRTLEGSSRGTTQNPRRHWLLCFEDWWLFHHQSVTVVYMNSFPNDFCPNHGFPLGYSPIARWHQTFASMWDLHYSWQHFELLRNSFPCQVSPIDRHLQQIFQDFDIHTRSSPGFDKVEDDTTEGILAVKFIMGRDFAVTRPSPEFCWARFAIAAMQAVELKWLISNKFNKWFHSSRVKFPFGQDVCELVFGIDVFDLDIGVPD